MAAHNICSRGHRYVKSPCPTCYPGYYRKQAKRVFSFRGVAWRYPGMAGWVFVNLPKKLSEELRRRFGASSRGWGSLPINATLGQTKWQTSIFPDKRSASYLLPLKAEVRKKEQVVPGATIKIRLEIRL